MHYVLKNKHPVKATLMEWARFLDSKERIIAADEQSGICVSTVFIGLESGKDDQGRPIVFETMIFGGADDQYQVRYSTYDAAVAGHARALEIAGIDDVLDARTIGHILEAEFVS